jgi:GDP-L-fucose synthase
MKHLGVKIKISYLKNKPNGTMRKVLDVSLAKKYGWKYKTSLKKGLSIAVSDYLKRYLV